MESLRTMAVAITVLVGLLSVGCLVIAMATVYLSSSMSAQARSHEIGVLQALGLQRRTISSIFARQGFVVGVLAFAVASTAIAVGEPVLRQVAAEVVALPLDELFERPLYSIEYLWIHALALAVAVLICMAGAAMPARGLAKRRVTELLRLQV
jgi:ABC-type antimicrobial peptide transport system permease subunit